jgi:hypothetical protein
VQVDVLQQRHGATTAAVRIATAAMQLDGLAEPVRVDVAVTEAFERLVGELVANELG